ncbi:MAG: thymidine phosphorylase [Lachnospiraceae bacterium]|nr:thymidine phosphorylase [Lachnospiraceae bacterium]
MNFINLITKKKNKGVLTKDEIDYIIDSIGTAPDYQYSALLMAICLNGMNKEETVNLTYSMLHSGSIMDLSGINGLKVDKHSTGGVADTTTMILAPLTASLGLPVVKMSGRGLGFTGGTVDKFESIPGFKLDMPMEQAVKQVNDISLVIMSQTKNLCPADGYLYKLRDVTGTVESIPLIASSIMSKKLASGTDGIVLDVKCGNGAFMKNKEDAISLAKTMIEIGESLGKKVSAIISDMSQPLGNNIGNTIEVIEALEVLKGNLKGDLYDVSLTLGSDMLVIGGIAEDTDTARKMLEENIANHKGLEKFRELISYQGGNPDVIDDYSLLKEPLYKKEIFLDSGNVKHLNAELLGRIACALGAGRTTHDMPVDSSAGIILNYRVGDSYDSSLPFAVLQTDKEDVLMEAERIFKNAVTLTEENVEKTNPIIMHI